MANELLDVNTEPVKTAQTNAPGTEPSGWMPLSEEQRNTIPENLKDLFEKKNWTSAESIANCYADLQSVLGKGDHIFKPEDPNNVEAMNKYYTQLGRPESYDKYEIPTDEEGLFDKELIDLWKKDSFQRGKSQKEMVGDLEFYRGIIKNAMEISEQEKAERETQAEADKEVIRKALVTRFGGEVAYQNKMIESKQIADSLGIYATLEKKGLASDPEIIGMLHDIVEKTAEGILTKDTPPLSSVKDPKEELKEIMASETFKNRFAPGRRELMKRYMELNNIIANSENAPKRVQDG